MQLGKRAVGAPCRQLAPCLPVLVQRNCRAQAARDKGRDGRSRSSGQGQGAAPSTWLLPTSLVSERPAKDGASPVADPEAPLTVYTIRFTTGTSRGAALSDPSAAVNVCLIGQDGRGALHRVSPVNDPLQSRAHALEMCQLIGPDVGADCSITLAAAEEGPSASGSSSGGGGAAPASSSLQRPPVPPSSQPRTGPTSLVGRPPPPPPPKLRFQEGSVDEVCILVPELGPLAGVLVGVEGGTWYLDEMDVASSRTHHMDRFVCRRLLGGAVGEGAAMLTPVPAGAVVYGEGEAAVVLSKEQAAALWSMNMNDYGDLKRRVAATTALLVASGASLAALTGGTAAALPYAAGGAVGLMYQWMLMRGVDHVMEAATGRTQQQPPHQQSQQTAGGSSSSSSSSSPPSSSPRGQQFGGSGGGGAAASASASASAPPTLVEVGAAAQPADAARPRGGGGSSAGGRLLASAPVRLGFVCASAALGLALLSQEEAGGLADTAATGYGSSAAAWQLALGALGFLTYKVALVGVSLGDSASGGAAALAGLPALLKSGGAGGAAEFEKYKRD